MVLTLGLGTEHTEGADKARAPSLDIQDIATPLSCTTQLKLKRYIAFLFAFCSSKVLHPVCLGIGKHHAPEQGNKASLVPKLELSPSNCGTERTKRHGRICASRSLCDGH